MSNKDCALRFNENNKLFIEKLYKKLDVTFNPKDENILPIILDNVNVGFANSLRRILMTEIQNYAFAPNKIKIDTNESQWNVEVLAERISFITINAHYIDNNGIDIDKLLFKFEDIINEANEIIFITLHKYLKVYYMKDDNDVIEYNITDICPYDSELLTLKKGEKFSAHMKLTKSCGAEHSRWNTGHIMYKFMTESDMSNNDIIDEMTEQMNYIKNAEGNPKHILMIIESFGKYPSIILLKKAFEVLKNKTNALKYSPDNQAKISIDKSYGNNNKNSIHFILNEENDTMGCVIEGMGRLILKKIVNNSVDLIRECIVTVHKTNPSDKFINLYIRTPDNYDAINIYNNTLELIIDLCDILTKYIK